MSRGIPHINRTHTPLKLTWQQRRRRSIIYSFGDTLTAVCNSSQKCGTILLDICYIWHIICDDDTKARTKRDSNSFGNKTLCSQYTLTNTHSHISHIDNFGISYGVSLYIHCLNMLRAHIKTLNS